MNKRTGRPRRPAGAPLPKVRFKQSEIERAIRSVRNQGLAVGRVEIDPATGRVTIVPVQPSNPNVSNQNPWDTVLAK